MTIRKTRDSLTKKHLLKEEKRSNKLPIRIKEHFFSLYVGSNKGSH